MQCTLCFHQITTFCCSNCLGSSLGGKSLYSIAGTYKLDGGEKYYFDERIWEESRWAALESLREQLVRKHQPARWHWESVAVDLVETANTA